MSMETINLVNEDKAKCCGCGLCMHECPVKAITMAEDDLGYMYPNINMNICIKCGKCSRVCILNNIHEYNPPLYTYAGVRNDQIKLQRSSSGGTFAAVAESVLRDGGIVCAARINTDFSVEHVIIDRVDELGPLLGSKYVQSSITKVFDPIKKALNYGTKVLFCGTPCQVNAIKKYTGESNNLFTMEVVCHGVPNQKMFKSYLQTIGNKSLESFVFRDKGQGWSFNHKAIFKDHSEKRINHRLSSYMTLFMKGCLYRESCYICPYAQNNRNADITIGDFWGIVRKRPEIAKRINIDGGVSCVIVNTEKGNAILKISDISLYGVEYSDITDGNGPLNHPSVKGQKMDEVLSIWKKTGSWDEIEIFWKKTYYKKRFKIWALLPNSIRNAVRVLLKVR